MKEVIKQKLLETKRQVILEEVSKIFESEGFASVKMQEIAKRVGISVGALYKLFDSKEAIYDAYIAYQIHTFYEELQKSCSVQNDPKRCLAHYIKRKFEAFITKRKAIEDPIIGDPLFFLKMHTKKSDLAKPIFEYLAALFEKLDRTEPLKEKDMLKVAYLFNAFTTGYIEYWLCYGDRLEALPEQVLAQFLEGMKA